MADEQKEIGELDLVDHYRPGVRTPEFLQTPGIFKLSIFGIPGVGDHGIHYLEKEGGTCNLLKKSLRLVPSQQGKAPSANFWQGIL